LNPAENSPDRLVTTAAEMALRLGRICPELRIDLAGAVPMPCPLPHGQKWLDWVAAGRDGGLEYLTRDPEGRADPGRSQPWARSLLVFGQRYTDGWPEEDPDPVAGADAAPSAPWVGRVSRYARGLDYHDILLRDMKKLLSLLKESWPELRAHPYTDTGPFLEREYAWLAGLGWLGHNRCLIHEKLGSGLFLGVALTNLEIQGLPPAGEPAVQPLYEVRSRRQRPPSTAPWNLCGRCTRCLDACPTGALDLEKGLDGNLCLSTWTIEWRGRAPDKLSAHQGGILFGCDICQSVCPWNRRAIGRRADLPPVRAEYGTLTDHQELSLADLVEISDEEFRRRFRRTPLWRCHPGGVRRNAALVLRNLAASGEEKNS
jgi:epoxyqueuosine reductase